MGRWPKRHPDITLDVHASHGFHVALRNGAGQWRGLRAERLMDSPLIAVAAPARAARVRPGEHKAIATEPLLGSTEQWARFLALAGTRLRGKTVADFNDAGLMLQAAEQDLGIALARELLAADAVQAGRLVRMSPLALEDLAGATCWFVHPPELADWPPLAALRTWLRDEMALARAALAAQAAQQAATAIGASGAGL